MAILIFPIVFYCFFVYQIQNYFIDIEFEGKQKKRWEEITVLYLFGYFLYKSHLIDLPLYGCSDLTAHLLLSRLLLSYFAS